MKTTYIALFCVADHICIYMLILPSLICLMELPAFQELLSDDLKLHLTDHAQQAGSGDCILESDPVRCRMVLIHVHFKTLRHDLRP